MSQRPSEYSTPFGKPVVPEVCMIVWMAEGSRDTGTDCGGSQRRSAKWRTGNFAAAEGRARGRMGCSNKMARGSEIARAASRHFDADAASQAMAARFRSWPIPRSVAESHESESVTEVMPANRPEG